MAGTTRTGRTADPLLKDADSGLQLGVLGEQGSDRRVHPPLPRHERLAIPLQLAQYCRLAFGTGVVLMVEVLDDERVEGFLGAEQARERRPERLDQPLLYRGAVVRTGNAPAGIEAGDQVAGFRRVR